MCNNFNHTLFIASWPFLLPNLFENRPNLISFVEKSKRVITEIRNMRLIVFASV